MHFKLFIISISDIRYDYVARHTRFSVRSWSHLKPLIYGIVHAIRSLNMSIIKSDSLGCRPPVCDSMSEEEREDAHYRYVIYTRGKVGTVDHQHWKPCICLSQHKR